MSKVIIDIEGTPREGDMLIFRSGKFYFVNRNVLLSGVVANREDIAELKDRVEKIEKELAFNRGEGD